MGRFLWLLRGSQTCMSAPDGTRCMSCIANFQVTLSLLLSTQTRNRFHCCRALRRWSLSCPWRSRIQSLQPMCPVLVGLHYVIPRSVMWSPHPPRLGPRRGSRAPPRHRSGQPVLDQGPDHHDISNLHEAIKTFPFIHIYFSKSTLCLSCKISVQPVFHKDRWWCLQY